MEKLLSRTKLLPTLILPVCNRSTAALTQRIFPKDNTSGKDVSGIFPFEMIPGPNQASMFRSLLQYGQTGSMQKEKYHEILVANFRTYGRIFKQNMGGITSVHVIDPSHVKKVYSYDGKTPNALPLLDPTKYYRLKRKLSPGLGNCNGEDWYKLKSAVRGIMDNPKSVANYLPQVNQVVDDFLVHINPLIEPSSGEIPNFENQLRKWVLESAVLTGYGKRLGSFDAGPDSFQQNILDAGGEILKWGTKLSFSFPLYQYLPWLSSSWKKFVEASEIITISGHKLLDEAISEISKLEEKYKDDEATLKEQKNRYAFIIHLLGKDTIGYNDIAQLTGSLYEDGLNGTARNMVAQLYCLATNPKKQQTLYEEICKLPSDINTPVTSEAIEQASYLKACIKECLRLYPVGVDVVRVLPADIVLDNYHIPAGTPICMNNNMALRLPDYVPEPEEYIPERWLRETREKYSFNPYLHLPFSFGPRACVGKRFAEQEMQVLIIKLLQIYKLEWPHQSTIETSYNTMFMNKLPAEIKLVPRANKYTFKRN